jgi:hypothetical protein
LVAALNILAVASIGIPLQSAANLCSLPVDCAMPLAVIIDSMNEAQKKALQNVKRAANSAGRLAESGYRLTKDEGARKIAQAVLELSEMVKVVARGLLEEGK